MLYTSIPYAPAESVPAKLPTIDEINNSQEVFVDQTAQKVVGVGKHFIVKYGPQIDLEEGWTMIVIREHTEVPVPQAYALFHDSETRMGYIIMERIIGTTLRDAWPSLSSVEKDAVSAKIKNYIDIMRLTPPPKAYGSVGNRPLRDPIFWTHQNLGRDGPFNTESEFNDALIKQCFSSEHQKGIAEFFGRHLPSVLNGHPPVLTHGDLQRKNIMIRIESNLNINITFLDWETAGWYPSYWEYLHATRGCGRFEDDWHFWVDDRILHPFPNEWMWVYNVMSHLW